MIKNLFPIIPRIENDGIVLDRITQKDAEDLKDFVSSSAVYEYEPTFLFEKKYDDVTYVINHLYDECLESSLILGIYVDDKFAGIAEFYGFSDRIHKVSIGFRLSEKYWGRGIGTRAVKAMIDYLETQTNIEIIQASTLPENNRSARVLEKLGFTLVVKNSGEDWGFGGLTPTDKWIL